MSTTPDKTAAKTSTPKVEVTVKTEKVQPQGLAADAKIAKAQYEKEDAASAATHQELRDNNKIVDQTPIIGYEAARANMHLPAEEKVLPEVTEGENAAPVMTPEADPK